MPYNDMYFHKVMINRHLPQPPKEKPVKTIFVKLRAESKNSLDFLEIETNETFVPAEIRSQFVKFFRDHSDAVFVNDDRTVLSHNVSTNFYSELVADLARI